MKVAITDFSFPTLEIEEAILRPAGCEIISGQWKTTEALIPVVSEADAVITQFAPIRAEVIAAMRRAKVIVRYGIGVDNIDLAAARAKGIPACNVPDYCINEVADHTLAFILSMTRQVVPNHRLIQDGKWGLATPLSQMKTLCDQAVGIVGFGRIGREVAARLQPFQCRRLVFDPVVPAETIRSAGCEPATFEMLLKDADIVTLHCPSTDQTRRILNSRTLAQLKTGAIVINLARGDLIETSALVEALQTGRLSGAAIDVCDPEPIPLDSPLRTLTNVICASHVASASVKAVTKLRETAARIALLALQDQPLPNIVN